MEWFFQLFGILSSNVGILLTGSIAALLILLWDWRFALIGVSVIQLSAATSAVLLHGVPAEWAFIQTVVIGLVCLMLGLSARAHALRPSVRQTGTWVSRGLLLAMFVAGAWFMNIQIALPGMDPLVMEMFVWLILAGVMLLGLSDHPLYNAAGLLLWLIPIQVIVAVLTPIPVIVAFVGLLILLLGLAVSYLVFVEHMPTETGKLILTDLAFPQQQRLDTPVVPPSPPTAGVALPPVTSPPVAALTGPPEHPGREEPPPSGTGAGTEARPAQPSPAPGRRRLLSRRSD